MPRPKKNQVPEIVTPSEPPHPPEVVLKTTMENHMLDDHGHAIIGSRHCAAEFHE